jgi:hypothetical protein
MLPYIYKPVAQPGTTQRTVKVDNLHVFDEHFFFKNFLSIFSIENFFWGLGNFMKRVENVLKRVFETHFFPNFF